MTGPSDASNDGAASTDAAGPGQRTRPLTSTERSRNSRARRRAQAAIARRRPDLSPGAVDPLAAAIVGELVASGDCPTHLLADDGSIRPRWRYAVDAFARTEATVRLIAAWVAGMPGVEAALSEVTTSDETASHSSGRSVKRTVTKRIADAMSYLDRAERRAAAARAAVGLDPASAARMGLDLGRRKDTLLAQVLALQLEDSQREDADAG